MFISEYAYKYLPEDTIEKIKQEQIQEINRRINVLREGKPLPDIKDKTVILVDDGLAWVNYAGSDKALQE